MNYSTENVMHREMPDFVRREILSRYAAQCEISLRDVKCSSYDERWSYFDRGTRFLHAHTFGMLSRNDKVRAMERMLMPSA